MNDYQPTRTKASIRSPSGLRIIIGAALAAFLLGAATVWSLSGGASALRGLFSLESDAPADAASDAAGEPASTQRVMAGGAAAQGLELQDELDRRVAEMEQRLSRLDLQSQAAAGNAARAEGLLIVLATRRAIERGATLGYLEDQLRLRFGAARPNAVRTVVETARDPITLDQLLARLDGLEPRLAQSPQGEGSLEWLSRELGSLFVVRREDAPSPAPQRRLERARLFLESGRIEAAVSEIRLMPGASEARDWIADAERYARAQRALEQLETAALLERSELRDSSGEPVEQPAETQP